MNGKQLEKRRELYAVMMKITELQPWDTVPEDIPLIYNTKDGEGQIFFQVLGQSGGGFGVICYPSFYDYVCSRKRMKMKNTKNEPVILMDNKFLCFWGNREDVDKENKALIKELGYKFRGRDGWLFFTAVRQRCLPSFLTEGEAEFLTDALGNLLLMLEAVCKNGLEVDFEKGQTVFRSYRGKGKWMNFPGLPMENPQPRVMIEENEDIKNIARMREGSLVIELDERCLLSPCREEGTGVKYFPHIITVMDSKTGRVLEARVLSYDDEREGVLFDIIADLSDKFGKVKQIKINDEFTRASLADFCKKTNIKLNYQQKPLKNIDIFMKEFLEEAPEEAFGRPAEEESAKSRSAGSKAAGKGRSEKTKNSGSYVISVSLGAGCYRHIKISGDSVLEELHAAILEAFGFEDDHAHAFFLDNKAWSGNCGYYSRYIEDEEKFTCDFTLSRVLEEKHKFLYIFDFGDEWRFSCRVLRITNEACGKPCIIRSAGDSPEQYPDYEEY